MKKNLLAVLLVSLFSIVLFSTSALAVDKGGTIGPVVAIGLSPGGFGIGVKAKMPPYGDLAFLKNIPGLHYELSFIKGVAGTSYPSMEFAGLLRITIMRTRSLRPYFGPAIQMALTPSYYGILGVVGAEYGLGAFGLPEKLSADANFRVSALPNPFGRFEVHAGAIYRFGGMD